MKDKRIEAVKNWPELKSIRDIQVFLGFPNFYCFFRQGFSKITGLLTSILKISNLSENFLNKMVEDNEMVGKSQILAKSKKSKNHQNLAKSKKSN